MTTTPEQKFIGFQTWIISLLLLLNGGIGVLIVNRLRVMPSDVADTLPELAQKIDNLLEKIDCLPQVEIIEPISEEPVQ